MIESTLLHQNLKSLDTFCEVARHLSFKEAAEFLCLTPSAVSHQVSDLEEALGVRLFIRKTRAIALTESGKRLFGEVDTHLRAIKFAAASIRADPARITLTVRMPEYFSSELFVPHLSGFSSKHESIDLQVESTRPQDSAVSHADINIVLSGKRPAFPRSQRLFPIRYVPACGAREYAKWSKLDKRALAVAPLLLHKARPLAWNQWAELAGVNAPEPRQIIKLDTMYGLARAAENGAGIALIPMPVSQRLFANGTLIRLFDDHLTTSDYYHIAGPSAEHQSQAADELWQWIVTTFADYDADNTLLLTRNTS